MAIATDPPAVALMVRPTLRWMLSHPAHSLALGLGSGLAPFAPGTWGTLAAWLGFVLLDRWLDAAGWWLLIVMLAAVGAVAAERAGRALNRPDHPAIVVDEIVAFWIVLVIVPDSFAMHAFAFVLFRFFDIVKPPPAATIDRRFKHGAGVMLDDLVAAFYTLLIVAVIARLMQ